MRSIFILLTRSQTIASRVIHMVTDAQYTHSSLSFEEDMQEMYSFGRKYTHLVLPAGFRIESLHRGFYKAYNQIPCALYEFQISDESYDHARAIVDEMVGMMPRYSYSLLGLLYCRLGLAVDRGNKYFCSEFIAEVLDKSGAMEMPCVPSLMRPIDFASLPGGVKRYEGTVGDLLEQILAEAAAEPEAEGILPISV
ncbi:MAG: hypothetical protein IJF79_09165 [Clostridia bacterium]|nr:hypothetical protein [Clostridia bacterium]